MRGGSRLGKNSFPCRSSLPQDSVGKSENPRFSGISYLIDSQRLPLRRMILHYHIVFPVKYRKALLSVEVTKALKEISKGFEERFELDMDQIGCDENHIHILAFIHPKYSIGQFVRL